MRHRKAGVKLGRTGSHRNAMFRNMVTSLLKHGKIKTTDTKAKELRRWADHIVTLAKRGDLHARRQALAIVREKQVVHKLFEVAQEQFGDRPGGYTRLTKLGHRAGDGAPMTLVELVTPDDEGKKKKKAKKSKPKAVAPVAKETTPPAGEAAKEEPAEAAEAEEATGAPEDDAPVAEVVEPEAAEDAAADAEEETTAADSSEEGPEDTPDDVPEADTPEDQPEEDKE